ncbi:Nuclear envelope morphology protein 1 [Mortierella sp. GBA39]|nr:Nuclear envelope morphology protein 1 [Mortierella sp. GBA39]
MTPSTTFQKSAPASSLSVALCRSIFLKYIYMTYLFLLQLLALPSAAFQRFVRRRRSGLSLDSKKNDNSVDNGSGGALVGAVGEKFVQQYTLDNHLNTSTSNSINNNNTSNNNGNSMLRRSSRFKSRSDLEEIAQSSTMSVSDPTLFHLSSTSPSTLTPSSRYTGASASVSSSAAGTLTPRNSSTFSHAGYGTDSMAEDGSGDNSTTRGNNVRLRQRMGRPMSGLSSGYHGAGAGGMGARKKTLVLDLDETLIHSTSRGSRSQGYMVEVLVDRHACLYYVYKRPHVDYFLKKVNFVSVAEWYKLVIFTASMAEYADPVIDWLDQSKTLFDKRYFRQACFLHNGSYLKDLTVIDSDLSSVCLLDNSPMSYSLNKENGIPIDTWIDDPNDEALLDLLPFLDALRFTEDVRSVLSLRTV